VQHTDPLSACNQQTKRAYSTTLEPLQLMDGDEEDVVIMSERPPPSRRARTSTSFALSWHEDESESSSDCCEPDTVAARPAADASTGGGLVPGEAPRSPSSPGGRADASTGGGHVPGEASRSPSSPGGRSVATVASVASAIPRRRNPRVAVPFATGRITPRQLRGHEDITGFQATCCVPGHDSCSKELSISKAGGNKDVALRMLKYWIVLGEQYENKAGHKGTWDMIVKAAKDNELPTDEFLDACVSSGLPTAPEAPDKSVAAPSTPRDVHDRLQALVDAGVLPNTSAESRRRNRMRPGRNYRTPLALTEALEWGYISPNLPNPLDHRWIARGNDWILWIIMTGG